jgi:DNA-binding NarL/FixJ family response regulator
VVTVPATHRPLRLTLVTHADGCAARVAALLGGEVLIRFTRLDEALRHLAHADVDCVLLDADLPEASAAVGGLHRRAPIVALTGRCDDAEASRLIRAGAQDLVPKDVADGATLLRAARNAVERHRTGERLEVERMVREVAADVRAGSGRRPARLPLLGGAALIAAFCL